MPKPHIPCERVGKITARLVLSHRTGFPNWRGDDGSLPIYFSPGERFSYSREGYIYLQNVVEQITGKPLNVYMDEVVFQAVGDDEQQLGFDSLTVTGYDSKRAPGELEKPKEAGAASSLNTTARDYALFVDAVLNGKGLSSSVLSQMETLEIGLDPTCRICVKQEPKELSKTLFWGLGWGIQSEHKSVMLWHWGDNGVFKTFVMADPARKSGVVMFANGEDALNVAKPIIDTAIEAGWIQAPSATGLILADQYFTKLKVPYGRKSSAGAFQPRDLRGRALSIMAMSSSWFWEKRLRSWPLGRY